MSVSPDLPHIAGEFTLMELPNMGTALHKIGDRDRALKYAELAYKIFKDIEDPRFNNARKVLLQWRKQKHLE